MTLLEYTFHYVASPGRCEATALGLVRTIYGIRSVQFDEARRAIRVEYDSSRLTKGDVESILRNAAIKLCPQ
jgi:copper chaperone CopZ